MKSSRASDGRWIRRDGARSMRGSGVLRLGSLAQRQDSPQSPCGSSGKSSENTRPLPGTLRTDALPPCASGACFIALTGWGQYADRQRAKEAGFHRHLVKPVDPEVLGALLGGTHATS